MFLFYASDIKVKEIKLIGKNIHNNIIIRDFIEINVCI